MRWMCIAIAIFAFAGGEAVAQKSCTRSDSAAAEKALDRVVNWDLMYQAWQEFQHCDAGLTEDFFTDAFMRLAVEWKHVDEFAAKFKADPQFKAFVKKQMSSLSAREDVKSLHSRATQSCPPKLDAFCTELADMAKAAM